jgi:hypothetical protein
MNGLEEFKSYLTEIIKEVDSAHGGEVVNIYRTGLLCIDQLESRITELEIKIKQLQDREKFCYENHIKNKSIPIG